MRKQIAALVCALAALAFAGGASAGIGVGVNEDTGKWAEGPAATQFWSAMSSLGIKSNTMTVLWDETSPETIPDLSFLKKALPLAAADGVKVVFDVYPMRSRALTGDPNGAAKFAAFVQKLAQTFPQVTEYVVMNECNQPRFLNPQFDASKQNQSAAICGQALAAAYDALKAVNSGIFVWGVGLSPRGNDNADASSNVSTSPVKFLGYLGAWYRASGRTAPLMDGFDFHPYPIPQSLPFEQGYADTDNASVTNLGRIYQAFYDGFKGTGQRTIGQQSGGGLPVSLNEVGIQTSSDGKPGYTGSEASANGAGGVVGATATEQFQADWYSKMLRYVACDPNIRAVNIFHLIDETQLESWQSGLYYVGWQAKASAAVVRDFIAGGASCSESTRSWRPTASSGGDSGSGGGSGSSGSVGSGGIQQVLQTLQSNGFVGTTGSSVGSFSGFPMPQGLDLGSLFTWPGPALGSNALPPDQLQTFGNLYTRFAQSTLQSGALPNVPHALDSMMSMLSSLMGRAQQRLSTNAALFVCTGSSCSLQQLAQQAVSSCSAIQMCTGNRSTSSARALSPLYLGSATVKPGSLVRVKLSKRGKAAAAYGSYAFVLRVAGTAPGSEASAVAVRFTLATKKAATTPNAKPTKTPKPRGKKR